MAGSYTPELVTEMRNAGAFTYASAVAFAAVHGLKPKSVIAKIVSEGIPYEAKPKPVSKKIENELPKKAEVLGSIFAKIGVELPSMERMTVAELMTLDGSLIGEDADAEDSADADGNVA
jgi:hypothetical protein